MLVTFGTQRCEVADGSAAPPANRPRNDHRTTNTSAHHGAQRHVNRQRRRHHTRSEKDENSACHTGKRRQRLTNQRTDGSAGIDKRRRRRGFGWSPDEVDKCEEYDDDNACTNVVSGAALARLTPHQHACCDQHDGECEPPATNKPSEERTETPSQWAGQSKPQGKGNEHARNDTGDRHHFTIAAASAVASRCSPLTRRRTR